MGMNTPGYLLTSGNPMDCIVIEDPARETSLKFPKFMKLKYVKAETHIRDIIYVSG